MKLRYSADNIYECLQTLEQLEPSDSPLRRNCGLAHEQVISIEKALKLHKTATQVDHLRYVNEAGDKVLQPQCQETDIPTSIGCVHSSGNREQLARILNFLGASEDRERLTQMEQRNMPLDQRLGTYAGKYKNPPKELQKKIAKEFNGHNQEIVQIGLRALEAWRQRYGEITHKNVQKVLNERYKE